MLLFRQFVDLAQAHLERLDDARAHLTRVDDIVDVLERRGVVRVDIAIKKRLQLLGAELGGVFRVGDLLDRKSVV